MPKHRGHGDGALYSRLDRNGRKRWCAELIVGRAEDGKPIRWRASGYVRRRVADALAEAQQQLREGRLPTGPKQTVAQYLTYWLEQVVRPSCEARTYHGYEEICRLHLSPALGKIEVGKLSAQDVQPVYTAKLASLSPRRVHHIHAVLHAALENAVKSRLLNWNPCDGTRPPKVPKIERQTFGPDEARAFVEAAQGHPLGALWITTICTGLREGEVLNLKWSDLDLERGILSLRRARTRVPRVGLIEKAPKSDKGRAIPLIPLVVETLRRHRCRQVQAIDYVFTDEAGRAIDERDMLRRDFYPFLQAAGLPRITFHDLRHSCATLLLSLGVDLKIISTILGHSTITITSDTYLHPATDVQRAALDRLDGLLGKGNSRATPAQEPENPAKGGVSP